MLEGCQDFTGNGASSRVSEAVAVFVLMNLVTAIIAGSRVGFEKGKTLGSKMART